MIRRILLFVGVVLLVVACNKPYKKTSYGFRVKLDTTLVDVHFYTPEIVRVQKSIKDFGYEKQSLAVVKTAEKVAFNISNDGERIIASTESLRLELDCTTGALQFFTPEGDSLLNEKTEGVSFVSKEDIGEATYAVGQSFVLDTDEFVYGLGQYEKGKMSQRNQTLKMVQDNRETIVPFIISNKNYGLYWDNYSPTTFVDTQAETSFESEVGDCIDYYFMAGNNADGVIANMRELTGRAPMMPYWTYGFWQSKERYKSQDETVSVIKRYRKLGVPIDGVIQDWQYWGDNYHWNAMEFINPEFPNPKDMIDKIHDLNAHIIISCWASFGPKTEPYTTLEAKGMLMDFTTWPESGKDGWPPNMDYPSGVRVYDAYNPEARNIYWNKLNTEIFSLGMDGWWLDSSEPDHLRIKEEDYWNKTHLGSFRRVRNAFPLMHVGGVASHQKETSEEKRVFILTRSGFAGQQRYGANSWSGDVVSDWTSLRQQISAGLNFSLTGIPHWNSDIGGFFVWNFPGGCHNKAYHELYVRWMQFGAFCPMMRSHGTDTPRELWHYGKEGDWTYDALKKMIELRYNMLPYIYSTSWDVTNNHSSMMRALMMDFSNDPNALDVDNQYMFGKNILVCPVTEPMYVDFHKDGSKYYAKGEDFSEAKSSEVYLPAGTQWYDFWTGELLDGSQKVMREAPIDILPLYVRAGAILPLGPKIQYANENIGPLTVRVYPGANGSFTFYDDERDNYNYEDGAYATINMVWDEAKQVLTLGEQNGTYEGMPISRKIKVVKVSKGNGTGMSGDDVPTKTVNYTGKEINIQM